MYNRSDQNSQEELYPMNFNPRQSQLLWWLLPVSLLLHFLLLQLLPHLSSLRPPPEEPVYVEVRPPQPAPKLSRELDVPPRPEPEKPRETPAKRLGPQDQVVEKEMAPKGEDTEDVRAPAQPAPPAPPQPAASATQQSKPQPEPQQKRAIEPPKEQPDSQQKEKPAAREETVRVEKPAPKPAPKAVEPPRPAEEAEKLPDISSLLKLPQQTASRVATQQRRKYREEIVEGDAVWLDMERDILISFFQRFRDAIYNVWNYPRPAAERGQEGTSLLRVTVRRDGSVEDVSVVESSGSPLLDDEAVSAVWKGGPYGPLPRAYDGETLTIFAHFQYRLGRTFMFGSS